MGHHKHSIIIRKICTQWYSRAPLAPGDLTNNVSPLEVSDPELIAATLWWYCELLPVKGAHRVVASCFEQPTALFCLFFHWQVWSVTQSSVQPLQVLLAWHSFSEWFSRLCTHPTLATPMVARCLDTMFFNRSRPNCLHCRRSMFWFSLNGFKSHCRRSTFAAGGVQPISNPCSCRFPPIWIVALELLNSLAMVGKKRVQLNTCSFWNFRWALEIEWKD